MRARRWKWSNATITVLATASLLVPTMTAAAAPRNNGGGGQAAGSASSWLVSSQKYNPTDPGEEPFTGNGYLGVRLPALGSGWMGNGDVGESNWPLDNHRSTTSLVAGVYQRPGSSDYISTLPTWTDVSFTVDGHTLDPQVDESQISNFSQSLDMQHSTVTTAFTWTPESHKSAQVSFTVLANRDRMHLGQVHASITPSWDGQVDVTSLLNGQGVQRIEPTGHSVDLGNDTARVNLTTQGRNTQVAMNSRLLAGAGVHVQDRSTVLPENDLGTAGITWQIPVNAGQNYEFTKYVGISTSNDQGTPADVAEQTVVDAVATGWHDLVAEHEAAWQSLWSATIVVEDQPRLQTTINSSLYLLYASMRTGINFSIPPAGLSSDNYAGVVFWDAETWMYPVLLALHPELARSIVQFRLDTIDAARANAQSAGYEGAMWPWDDGPSGLCGGLAPCKGYQDHVQSDISLAQWQYYEATGDLSWLRHSGYPVIKEVANFWTSRVSLGEDGSYHVNGVSSSDEFAGGVDDDAMTNASAIVSLTNATEAASLLGETPNPDWADVASKIYVPQDADGSHPEFAGYTKGRIIKQASAILMTYPFEYVTDNATAAADLDRYMPVTDTGGPAMTASVESIIASQVREPGCLNFTRFQNSYMPFIRGSFEQFNETQYEDPSGGQSWPTFSFGTGAGGFLQTLTNGFTGLRWDADTLRIDPTLPRQLAPGMVVRGLKYHGSSIDIDLGLQETTVSMTAGDPIDVTTPEGEQTLTQSADITVDTARPDLDPTDDLARCQDVHASSQLKVSRAAAAVDGNDVTSWTAEDPMSRFHLDLSESAVAGHMHVTWGATRPQTYILEKEDQAGGWHELASGPVPTSGGLDPIWDPVAVRHLRLTFKGGDPASISDLRLIDSDAPNVVATTSGGRGTTPGGTLDLSTEVTSIGDVDVENMSVQVSAPDGWSVSPVESVPSSIDAGASATGKWRLTAPSSAATTSALAQVTVSWQGTRGRESVTKTVEVYAIDPVGVGAKVEAEGMVRGGGAHVSSDHSGYTGEGFVDNLYADSSLTGLVQVPQAGIYTLTARYANDAGGQSPPYERKTRTISVVAGGQTQQLEMPPGDGWGDWVTASLDVSLDDGDNLIQLVVGPDDDGSVNLDSIVFRPADAAQLVTAFGAQIGVAPGSAGSARLKIESVGALDAEEVSVQLSTPDGWTAHLHDGVPDTVATGDTVYTTWSMEAPTVASERSQPLTATVSWQGASGVESVSATTQIYVLDPVPTGQPLEAEDMLGHQVHVSSNHSGYTGNGFVDELYVGSSLTGLVTVPTPGTYTLTARYANDAGGPPPGPYIRKTRTMTLVAGGESQQMEFPPGNGWDDWVTTTSEVHLEAGDDLLQLIVGPDDDGSVNLDSVTLSAEPTDADPVVEGTSLDPAPEGNGWVRADSTTVRAIASDDTTEPEVAYSLDGGTWQVKSDGLDVQGPGEHTVRVRATDEVGQHSSVVSVPVRLDAQDPATQARFDPVERVVRLVARDATSGVATTEYRFNGGSWTTYTGSVDVPEQGTTVEYRSTDTAGNREETQSLEVLAVPDVAATLTTAGGVAPGGSLEANVTVHAFNDADDVDVTLTAPEGWHAKQVDAVPETVVSGDTFIGTWKLTAPKNPAAASGQIKAVVTWDGHDGSESTTVAAAIYVLDPVESGQRLEAEDMVRAGGAWFAQDHPGYRGDGFVGGLYQGSSLSAVVNVPTGGTYSIRARYANDAGGEAPGPYIRKTRTITVISDGHFEQMLLPPGHGWDDWVTATSQVQLKAGDNLLRLVVEPGDDGSVNLDNLTLGAEPSDAVPTVGQVTFDPAPGDSGWVRADSTTVHARASDDRGVSVVEYSLDSAGWQIEPDGLAVVGAGEHLVKVRATDDAGQHSAVVRVPVRLDGVAPVTEAELDNQNRTVSLKASDATSGVDRIDYRLDGGSWATYGDPVGIPSAGGLLEYRAVDAAGNIEQARSLPVAGLPLVSSVAAPAVTGNLVVGEVVHASAGQWIPSDGLSLIYQWFADGEPIAGATQAAYTLDQAEAGARISVSVTAARSGYQAGTTMSTETDVVLPTPASVLITGVKDLTVGDSTALSAVVAPAEAAQDVVWSSSNEAVASVDGDGMVAAVGPGIVTITATTMVGPLVVASVTVQVSARTPTSVMIAGGKDLTVGDSTALSAVVAPAEAAQDVVWSSSNEAVASVDGDGMVAAVGPGIVTITARSVADLRVSDSVTLTISSPVATLSSPVLSVSRQVFGDRRGAHRGLVSVDVVGVSFGTVTFSEGSTVVGTAPVIGGVARLVLPRKLAVGEHRFTASMAATASTSAAVSPESAVFTVAKAALKKLKVKATKKVRKKGYRPHHQVKVKVKASKKITNGDVAKGKVKLRVKQHGSFTTVKKKSMKKFRNHGGKLKLKIAKRYVHGKKVKVKAVYKPKKAWRGNVKKKKQKIVLHRR